MSYYPAFICENGHVVKSLTETCSDKFCSTCGARVISKCPNCNAVIRGRPRETYGFLTEYTTPAYCKDCGKPYPWIVNAIEATALILQEEPGLTFDECQKLIDILPDVITETPKTQLAAVRIKKAFTTAGAFVADGLRKFAIDFGCELLKKQLDL